MKTFTSLARSQTCLFLRFSGPSGLPVDLSFLYTPDNTPMLTRKHFACPEGPNYKAVIKWHEPKEQFKQIDWFGAVTVIGVTRPYPWTGQNTASW
jgi:hypothetical protein